MIMTSKTRTNTHSPIVRRVTVNPAQAMLWLENTNTNNRNVCQKHVARLARDMAEGKWILTHAGIAFSSDGTLLDGQHRLWAVVEADVSVEMHVWFNVDPKSMMTIDCGKIRSTADILNIAGDNGDVTTYQLATLRAMLAGFGNPPTLSPSETSQALGRYYDAIEFSLTHLPMVAASKGVSTAAVRAVIARAWYSVAPNELKEFCRKLSTGIITSQDESLIVLLRQFLQAQSGNSYSERMQRYGKVQRALVAWLKGENPSRLFAATSEQFPLPQESNA